MAIRSARPSANTLSATKAATQQRAVLTTPSRGSSVLMYAFGNARPTVGRPSGINFHQIVSLLLTYPVIIETSF